MEPTGRIYPIANEGASVPRFGDAASRLATIRIPLDTALDKKVFKIGGTMLWACDASDNEAEIRVSFSERHADEGIPYKLGSFVRGVRFSELYLTSTAQAGKTITLAYMVEQQDNIQIENPADAFSSVSLTKNDTFDSLADVSLLAGANTQILAADTTRVEAIITNLTANTQKFRIGDAGAAAANGVELSPGQTIVLTTTAAIHGWNPGAGAESVSVAVVKD